MGSSLVRSFVLCMCAFWFAGLSRCQCIEVSHLHSQVFLAATVLRSTPAIKAYDVRLFAHVSDLTCLTVHLLSSSVGAPFHFLWFILHCWGRDAILVSGHA